MAREGCKLSHTPTDNGKLNNTFARVHQIYDTSITFRTSHLLGYVVKQMNKLYFISPLKKKSLFIHLSSFSSFQFVQESRNEIYIIHVEMKFI